MTVTLSYFRRTQGIFDNKISGSPITADIILETATPVADSLADFVGDSPRTSVTKTLPVLFGKNPESIQRTKSGLDTGFSAIVYFSPKHLVAAFGTYKLPVEAVTIVLQGTRYIIDTWDYLEEMYGSCVSVEYGLIGATKE